MVGQTWMALSTLKCNHLTPLHLKGLMYSFLGHISTCENSNRETHNAERHTGWAKKVSPYWPTLYV